MKIEIPSKEEIKKKLEENSLNYCRVIKKEYNIGKIGCDSVTCKGDVCIKLIQNKIVEIEIEKAENKLSKVTPLDILKTYSKCVEQKGTMFGICGDVCNSYNIRGKCYNESKPCFTRECFELIAKEVNKKRGY